MEWNANLYNGKHNYVAEYGKGLLEYVPDDKELRILDLGCGTGTLTAQLKEKSEYVMGVDASVNMVDTAKKNYPDIDFEVRDATNLGFNGEWDVVFSNAVFHWIKDHDLLLNSVAKALKPGGKLICEFGGHGNVSKIEGAFEKAIIARNYNYESDFNYPALEEFGGFLGKNGFEIEKLYMYDRPTPLNDGKNGLRNWLKQFIADDLNQFSEKEQEEIFNEVDNSLEKDLWDGEKWIADYKRLRAVAVKR